MNSEDETVQQCPSCGSRDIQSRMDDEIFIYGADPKTAVELTVHVPVHRCEACDIEYTDGVGEKVRHDAVCRHLGVMTPDEIIALRQSCGSRSELARLTRLEEQTVERWENANLIQNGTHDQLLYLLTFPDNVVRLKSRLEHGEGPAELDV